MCPIVFPKSLPPGPCRSLRRNFTQCHVSISTCFAVDSWHLLAIPDGCGTKVKYQDDQPLQKKVTCKSTLFLHHAAAMANFFLAQSSDFVVAKESSVKDGSLE